MIVLQPSDLPAGWKSTPHRDPNAAAEQAALARCLGVSSIARQQVAKVYSSYFTHGNAYVPFFFSSATSYRSQNAADANLEALANSDGSRCYEKLLKQAIELQPGATMDVSFKLTLGSAGGPDSVAATGDGTIQISMGGLPSVAYYRVAFIDGPLITAEVDAMNIGARVPTSLMQSLVASVANRAALAR